jgi:hypothetical protein
MKPASHPLPPPDAEDGVVVVVAAAAISVLWLWDWDGQSIDQSNQSIRTGASIA